MALPVPGSPELLYNKAEMVTSVNTEVVVKLIAFPGDMPAAPIGLPDTSAMTVLACEGATPPAINVATSAAVKNLGIGFPQN